MICHFPLSFRKCLVFRMSLHGRPVPHCYTLECRKSNVKTSKVISVKKFRKIDEQMMKPCSHAKWFKKPKTKKDDLGEKKVPKPNSYLFS